jgi:hypothetical protein
MMRPLFSSVMIALILVSQVGVPLHYHFCKGALESVSLFFKKECDDHAVMADVPPCCRKFIKPHCENEKKDCCRDQVKVLSQDLRSTVPAIPVLTEVMSISLPVLAEVIADSNPSSPILAHQIGTDSGPPVYVRYHALLFYDC